MIKYNIRVHDVDWDTSGLPNHVNVIDYDDNFFITTDKPVSDDELKELVYLAVEESANVDYNDYKVVVAKYVDFDVQEETLSKKESMRESVLTEGTANWRTSEEKMWPTFAGEFYEDVEERVRDAGYFFSEIEDGDEWDKLVKEHSDGLGIIYLDELKELEDDINDLNSDWEEHIYETLEDFANQTIKDAYDDDLRDFVDEYEFLVEDAPKISYEAGYYSGFSVFINGPLKYFKADENPELNQRLLKELNDWFIPQFKELCTRYGLTQIGITGRFSNGETVYHIVGESINENDVSYICTHNNSKIYKDLDTGRFIANVYTKSLMDKSLESIKKRIDIEVDAYKKHYQDLPENKRVKESLEENPEKSSGQEETETSEPFRDLDAIMDFSEAHKDGGAWVITLSLNVNDKKAMEEMLKYYDTKELDDAIRQAKKTLGKLAGPNQLFGPYVGYWGGEKEPDSYILLTDNVLIKNTLVRDASMLFGQQEVYAFETPVKIDEKNRAEKNGTLINDEFVSFEFNNVDTTGNYKKEDK